MRELGLLDYMLDQGLKLRSKCLNLLFILLFQVVYNLGLIARMVEVQLLYGNMSNRLHILLNLHSKELAHAPQHLKNLGFLIGLSTVHQLKVQLLQNH